MRTLPNTPADMCVLEAHTGQPQQGIADALPTQTGEILHKKSLQNAALP